MDRSLQPVFQMMQDYLSNYTTGNISNNNKFRALNRSIEDLHRQLGLTCDERIFNFLYSQDNMFTDLPTDFDEPKVLYYVNNAFNLGQQAGWNWVQYTSILQNSGVGGSRGYGYGYSRGAFSQKSFSSTNMNQKKQLIQIGANVMQGGIINPYNTLNLISATGDATTLAIDNNFWIQTGGSISFTIDPTLAHGYAGILTSGFGIMTVQQALQNNGVYKVYSWLPTTAISSIELILTSSSGSYTFSATTNDDGTPFVNSTLQGIWNRTQYQWSLVSISGSPNSQEITSYEVRYIEGAGFGSVAIPFFRIDDLYLSFPDNMNLVYYTQYKGTDSTGVTSKIILDSLSDLPTFMQFFPDFINMVALRGAYICAPQIALDKDFMKMYKDDYLEQMKDWGKVYPRRRIITQGQTVLRRP